MATPFQGLALIENFSFIFPFLLVLVLVFGLLSWIKLFGDNKGVNGMIAILVAIMVLFSPVVRGTINTAAPWFVLLFFFIVFALIVFKIFGFGDESIMGVISGEYKFIAYWMVALILIISIGSLTFTMSNMGGIGGNAPANDSVQTGDGSVASANQESSFWNTLVHPKVLGFILIMLIGMFTVQRLTVASG